MRQNERSQKTEFSREKELETVLKISQAVSRTLDLNKIFEMACRMTAQALGVERCSIGMVTSKDVYEIVHSYRVKPSYPSIAGVKFDLVEYPHLTAAYFSGKPIHLFAMNKRSLSSAETKLFKKLNLKVFLGIPMVVGGEVLGALHPGKVADPFPFSLSQIKLCQTIANQVGIAIRNARLLKGLKGRYEQQSLLLEISQSFFQSLNTQELLDIVILETCKALKMDRCAIAIFEPKRALSIIRSVYFRRKPESSAKSLLSTDYLQQVFRTASFKQLCEELEKGKRKYLLAEDVLSASSNQKARKYYRAAGVKSALIVPVFSGRTLIGLLNVSTMKDYHNFTDSEIKLFRTIGNLSSLALEKTQLLVTLEEEREELRVSHQEAQLANERLRYIMFSTTAVIYASKTSGDYGATFITDNVQRMTGYDPKNFIKNSSFWIDHLHPEDVKRILQELPNIYKKGYHTYEYRFRCKNGNYIWTHDQMKLIRDDKGQPLEIIGCWMDVTERKKAEEALLESEDRYRRLFEDSPISLWEEDFSSVKNYLDSLKSSGVKDLRAYFDNHPEEIYKCAAMVRIIAVNKTTLRWYEAKNLDELKSGLNKVFTKESYEVFKEGIVAIASGKTNFESDAMNQTFKGLEMAINIKWSVMIGYERSLSRLLVSIVDITERKLAEKQLTFLANRVIEAQEEERRMTSQKLHDSLVQDLTAIKLDLKMCLRSSPEEFVQIISRLKDDEALLTQTMENLRDLSSDLRPRILDELGLFSALRWYVDKFRRRTKLKVRLKITGSKTGLSPQTEIAIFRIIQEGLTNIAKHSEAESASLSLSAKAKHVIIVIKDNGIGFEPEHVDTPTSYGLLRMMENTKLLGGKFKVISRKGKGTTLHITIPY